MTDIDDFSARPIESLTQPDDSSAESGTWSDEIGFHRLGGRGV